MNTVAQTQTSSTPKILLPQLRIWPQNKTNALNPFYLVYALKKKCIYESLRWESGGVSGVESKRKGAGLDAVLGPGPGQSWQWLMRSDWAVLQCSGGSEPCSARETFQPLSPPVWSHLSNWILSPGTGGRRVVRGPRVEQEKEEGVGGAGVNLRPLTWSVGQRWAENRRASVCLLVHGIHTGLKCVSVRKWRGGCELQHADEKLLFEFEFGLCVRTNMRCSSFDHRWCLCLPFPRVHHHGRVSRTVF